MRAIKFRGKREDTKEWVYGSLINYKNEDYWNRFFIKEELDRLTFSEMPNAKNIYSVLCVEVIPKTVGQFTGLRDKNGTEIYEGDFLATKARDVIFEIIWFQESSSFMFKSNESLNLWEVDKSVKKLEVIGNIHDNPELLNNEKDI